MLLSEALHILKKNGFKLSESLYTDGYAVPFSNIGWVSNSKYLKRMKTIIDLDSRFKKVKKYSDDTYYIEDDGFYLILGFEKDTGKLNYSFHLDNGKHIKGYVSLKFLDAPAEIKADWIMKKVSEGQ